jgi:hypothetical protein
VLESRGREDGRAFLDGLDHFDRPAPFDRRRDGVGRQDHEVGELARCDGAAASTGALGGGDGAATQPSIGVRSPAVLSVEGKQFKDANGNGTIDRYEDWRLPVDVRVSRMTDPPGRARRARGGSRSHAAARIRDRPAIAALV